MNNFSDLRTDGDFILLNKNMNSGIENYRTNQVIQFDDATISKARKVTVKLQLSLS